MSKLDLNLCVIFDTIMQERSITAAADRLAMTQPSVSNAVSRMRYSWNDPLFVKHGRGVKPTPFATELWHQISDSINTISQAISPTQFVPIYAKRCFRIALTDGMTSILWLPLRKIIEQGAPGIDIHAVPYKGDGEALLLNAEVDLVLDYYPGTSKQINSQWMFDNHFVCVMNKDHKLATKELSLNRFVEAEHLLVSLSGDASGIVDGKLAEMGKTRRVAMTVNSFAGAFRIIQQTSLITVLPYPVVAQFMEDQPVIIKKVPIEVPPARISMAWHCREDRDPGLMWLRNKFCEIVESNRELFETVPPHN